MANSDVYERIDLLYFSLEQVLKIPKQVEGKYSHS